MTLKIGELEDLIGINVAKRLIIHFRGKYDTIKLRRVTANSSYINFHNDYAWRTMQILLNHESEYVGGRVINQIENNYYTQNRKQ